MGELCGHDEGSFSPPLPRARLGPTNARPRAGPEGALSCNCLAPLRGQKGRHADPGRRQRPRVFEDKGVSGAAAKFPTGQRWVDVQHLARAAKTPGHCGNAAKNPSCSGFQPRASEVRQEA